MVIDFRERVETANSKLLSFDTLKTLQVNLGNICNQACRHCHVEAGPSGTKIMQRDILEKIIDFVRVHPEITLDITGGCPELHPDFKYFLEETRRTTSRLMVRTNLTVLVEQGNRWIADWYKDNGIVLVASLPCYTRENVDEQRGEGVFEKSIAALRRLNDLGYGDTLELNLVYNPGGAFLPGSQAELEKDYKRELFNNYGVRFSNLFTINNAPVGRFKKNLDANGLLEPYTRLLADNFNPEAISGLMCRSLISVDWQGILYNCDFNLALGIPITTSGNKALDIGRIGEVLGSGNEIAVADHCYSCTAGSGSSCTGTLV